MATLPTFNAGTDPTAAQWQMLLPKLAAFGSDQTLNANTTLTNATSLVWALPASTFYELLIRVYYNSNSTANFKWALTFSGTGRADLGYISPGIGGGVVSVAQINYGSGTAIGIGGTGADALLVIHGTVNSGATPANLQFQFAQNTSNASNTILRGPSSGTLRQVT